MMQLVMLLLILLVFINRPVASAIVLADFQKQALDEHNYLRQFHCGTGPLTLNSNINNVAQSYAEYLAANGLFEHSGSGYGENLWATFYWTVINFVNGSTPTKSWYDEISLYNYSTPGFSSDTGHFTQVVWKGTTQLGIGIAFTNDSKSAYVVANYDPPGNYLDSFPANVLPPCSAATTITSTIPTTITSTIPTTKTSAITATVTSTIPTTKTSSITATVTSTIPTTKTSTIPTTKISAITTTIASTTLKPTTTTQKITTSTYKSTTRRRRHGRAIIES